MQIKAIEFDENWYIGCPYSNLLTMQEAASSQSFSTKCCTIKYIVLKSFPSFTLPQSRWIKTSESNQGRAKET